MYPVSSLRWVIFCPERWEEHTASVIPLSFHPSRVMEVMQGGGVDGSGAASLKLEQASVDVEWEDKGELGMRETMRVNDKAILPSIIIASIMQS